MNADTVTEIVTISVQTRTVHISVRAEMGSISHQTNILVLVSGKVVLKNL